MTPDTAQVLQMFREGIFTAAELHDLGGGDPKHTATRVLLELAASWRAPMSMWDERRMG